MLNTTSYQLSFIDFQTQKNAASTCCNQGQGWNLQLSQTDFEPKLNLEQFCCLAEMEWRFAKKGIKIVE